MGSRILLLLFFTSSVWAGTFELNQIQSLYEAVENQTITLEWTFTIRRPLRYYEVFCEHITDVRISVVLHVEQGVQFPDSQDPDFTGRVQFDEESFREGRLRVHVSSFQTLRIQTLQDESSLMQRSSEKVDSESTCPDSRPKTRVCIDVRWGQNMDPALENVDSSFQLLPTRRRL